MLEREAYCHPGLEAAKLLGVSVYAIRNCVAPKKDSWCGSGSGCLVPMEVLEKVMAEGVELKPKG